MKRAAVWAVAVCLAASLVTAQYGPPSSKGKKHRTTTTTTEIPGVISNEIPGPFPIPDSGSFSYSGSSVSSYGQPGNNVVTGGSYWWAGPDSPFKPNAQPAPTGSFSPPPPSPGCGGPAGCTGVNTEPRPSPGAPINKPVDIAQNPFLSSAILGKPIPQSPQGCQGYGGNCQGPPGQAPTQYPGPPANTGSFPSQSTQNPVQYPGQYPISTGPNKYPTQPTGSNQYPGQGTSPNQFQGQPTSPSQYPGLPQPTGPSQYPGQPSSPNQYPGQPQPTGPSQYPGQPSSPNQYPGKPSTPSQYPGQPQPTGPSQYPGYPSSPNQYPGQPSSPNQFPGQPTSSSQFPGQPQPTGPNQYPRQPSRPNQYPGQPQPTSPSQYPGQPQPSPNVPLRPQCSLAGHACVPSSMCVGGVITPNGMRQMRDPQVKECIPGLEACCKIPIPSGGAPFGGTPTPKPDYGAATQRPYTGPLNTTPYPGCAAALKCVAENYCTAEGVMSDSPVFLTREQADNKVPLTDCQDLETGIIGKCCRDPNYEDPWPGGMMMMKNPGGFDDGQYHGEGSGPGVNIGPSPNTISPFTQGSNKDHGPKPSIAPGGFNKPFPPPFPGKSPGSVPYAPGKPQTSNPYQPNNYSPSKPSYPPSQSTVPNTPYQQGQPSGVSYTTNQPNPVGEPRPSYQPGQPSGTPYQPGQSSPSDSPQPNQPIGTTFQPGQPTPPQPIPNQPGDSFQPGNIPPSSYQPNEPSNSPFQPPDTYQPGQPIPSGSPNQPGQPSVTPLEPSQQSPVEPSQPSYPGQGNEFSLPTHPGQNKPEPTNQGPAPGLSCGIRRQGPGGDLAGFGEFPWQALVVSAGNRSLLCGAAIIAENAVITAAHCVNQLKAQDLLVKAGEGKLLGQNPKPVQVRPVSAIARHPAYDSGSLAKDLAILLVAEPFTLDIHVDKICIPPELGSEYFQKPGQNCLITGWGKNALQGPILGSELHKIDVSVIPAGQCEEKLKTSQNLGKYFILNEGFSCAIPPSPEDLCKVDFGSAVACEREDGMYELAGVNSWDIACQTKQSLPTVFATSDAQWINIVLSTPLPVLQAQEKSFNQGLLKGEDLDGVDVEDKPGFSQGYGK